MSGSPAEAPVRAVSPCSLAEAVKALAEDPTLVPAAGCTDLMVGAGEGRFTPPGILNLLTVPEIRGITRDDRGWRIGAATPFTAIRLHAGLRAAHPILAEVAGVIGGWQIQNRATLGGNVANASPAGDSLPVLLALDASVTLAAAGGERTLPYTEFHTGYRETAIRRGEILAWIHVPDPPAGALERFRKIGTREAQAISKVVLALAARRDGGVLRDVRFGAGSVAATPVRLRAAEAACEGRAPDETTAEAAAAAAMGEVVPIDDVRSTAEYRLHVLGRAVRRMVLRSRE